MSLINFFSSLPVFFQALIATLFTWFITALGSSLIFFVKDVNKKILDFMLGFSAGVMIAASYWSLLKPAIELTNSWLQVALGFILGGFFLLAIDKILPHLHLGLKMSEAEGFHTKWHKSTLLVLAITLHNFPEGLAIGVAFGSAALGLEGYSIASAIILAVGIGLQNFPEGIAVSFPLKKQGLSKTKSFFYGQLSGIVEPISGILGASLVLIAKPILPYALAFAAGAMIFVVVEELIPESQTQGNSDLSTIGVILGFTIMMILDVAFE
ncbi:MAG: ZIP family metal transporter [Candidatus Woesearchaeota archaeon]